MTQIEPYDPYAWWHDNGVDVNWPDAWEDIPQIDIDSIETQGNQTLLPSWIEYYHENEHSVKICAIVETVNISDGLEDISKAPNSSEYSLMDNKDKVLWEFSRLIDPIPVYVVWVDFDGSIVRDENGVVIDASPTDFLVKGKCMSDRREEVMKPHEYVMFLLNLRPDGSVGSTAVKATDD